MSLEVSWLETVGSLKQDAQTMHEAREAGLPLCRQIIQTASKSIRHVHRGQFDEARTLLGKTRELSQEARRRMQHHGEILHGGYLSDAEKEMVEAAAVLAIVHDEAVPSRQELGVFLAAYLNGMAEAASEVRRYALDTMRKGNTQEAERILSCMEVIYDELMTFDYPDSLTGGLRRTCDALRAVIERTRSDLTTTAIQRELLQELRNNRES